MKKIKFFILIAISISCVQNSNLFAQNNFIIGMYGADYHVTEDEYGQVNSAITVTVGANTYYSSWFNVLAADGVNTCFIYRPDTWDTYTYRFKPVLTLIKNNGMKIIDFNRYWFKPNTSGSGGQNQYNLTTDTTMAQCNYDRCYNNVYNDATISSNIYAHLLGGEFNYKHSYPLYNIFPPYYPDGTNNQYWKTAEVPPQNVNDAVSHFITKRNSLTNTQNQKIIYNAAVHGGYIEGYHSDTTIYQPEDYVKMTGVSNLQKPDIFDEGSYFSNQFYEWNLADGSTYPNPTRYYLGKFRSIDFAKKYFKNVISEVDFEQKIGQPYIYSVHSNPTVPNANQVWFQSYTSIIHGAVGVVFYDLASSWMLNDAEDVANTTNSKPGYLAVPTNRYQRAYFPKLYRLYISNLSKELRYLVNQNLLSDDSKSIVISKTTSADVNGILPASTTYLPATVAATDARDFSAINNLPLTNTYTNNHRGEDYGIRYTVRTNGSDVIMIASNPNPYSVHSVNFNFTNVANPIIRNATSVVVWFDDNSVTNVNSTSYKTTRSGTVNSTNTSILKSHTKTINSHLLAMDFGPFDVKIFKFVSTPPSTNNYWSKIWTNNGSGNIGGWGVVSNIPNSITQKYIPIDVDGDGAQELLCIQWQSNGLHWSNIMKYNSTTNSWDWFWSNSGNGLIGSDWSICSDDKFYAGDFNNDGKEELLIFRNGNSWTNMYTFANGQWNWTWSNNGSGNFYTNWPQNDARYYVGDFDGDSKDEIISLSTNSTNAKMFKYSSGTWNSIWSNVSPNFAAAWPVNNSSSYFVGNFDGNTTDDLFSTDNYWSIYLYYSNNIWNWGGSNNGATTVANWSLPFASTDKILSGKIDSDNLAELMFIKRGTAANLAQTADYSATTLTRRWYSTDNIKDWPIADGVGSNTEYYLIKANASEPAYLLAMRGYGSSNIYLVNMYKSDSGYNKSAFISDDQSIDDEGLNNSDLSIYPNPTDGNFIIDFADQKAENVSVSLFNTTGQLFYSKKYENNGQNQISINCNLPSGIYFYNITNNLKKYKGKLIIK